MGPTRTAIEKEERMMRRFLTFGFVLVFVGIVHGAEVPVSEDTESCLDCHESLHPGIVEAWKKSRHARITPAEAMSVKGLARKVSSKSVPESLKNVVLGCAECHTLRPEAHEDTFEHNGYEVHVVVSPKDCRTCHSEEAAQYEKNLMSRAHGNLMENSVYRLLIRSINDTPTYEGRKMSLRPSNEATNAESCLYCHGTKLKLSGTVSRESEFGEMDFPVIEGWPNQGSGRINLDGSRGACTACHTRHRFSIEMARKPYTCKECHVGPDVPAFKVYAASKHGNIFSTLGRQWDFNSVPWTIGEDFTAPTCAACHISLLINTEGAVVVERTHEVKNRLAYRIFGLIYAHPHPKNADTTLIRNKDGLPLPTDFEGGFASPYLLNQNERDEMRIAMQRSCLACHDQSWVDGHWQRFENTLKESNAATMTATKIMSEIWEKEHAQGVKQGGSPFDEYIERRWSDTWLFYANSVRFASAMAGGGDYGVFADGRYHLAKSIQALYDWLSLKSQKTK
jgi:hypothetical protein